MNNETIEKIADTFDFGLIIENTNREVVFCNKKIIEIFDINIQSDGFYRKSADYLATFLRPHFKDKELFEWGLKELPSQCIKYENFFTTLLNRTIRLKYTPLFIDSVLKNHIWQFEDITELELKEYEIVKQREYYLKILNKIPTDIVIANLNHEFQFINEHAVKDKERRDALIGMNGNDYLKTNSRIPLHVMNMRNENFFKAIRENSKIEYVEELPTKEGANKYIYRTLQPVLNEKDNEDFVVISGTDITKQVEIEKNKQLLNARFEKIINGINNAVFQIDFSGKIIFVNNAAFELFPFFDKSADGYYKFVNTSRISYADRLQCLRPFKKVKRNKKEVSGIFTIGKGTESEKYLNYTYWYANTSEDGETIIGCVADVTSQYRELNLMKHAIEKEQELNAMKSKFINITSHEIRTPLSVILSSAEIIDMVLPEQEADLVVNPKEYTETIINEVNNVTSILNELLMVGEIETGKAKFNMQSVGFSEFVDSVVKRFIPYTDGRILKLHYAVDNNFEINIDKKLLKHALDNLLSNAFKYSPNKEAPQLSAFIQANQLVFTVQDYGIGIPQNELTHLFQSFYRASNVSNISGTGIGLMVVEYAAKMHQGRVEVVSVENEFTVFKLFIPLNPA